MSMANLGGFNPLSAYGGYFDPNKCYTYSGSGIPTSTPAPQMAEPKTDSAYFVPVSVSSTSPATCSGQWSGNYLNWAATQTIDTFRSVMTGGYRVIDSPTTTVLEKARHTGQTGTGDLALSNSASTVAAMTPSGYKYFYTRLKGLGNKMYFTSADSDPYNVTSGSGKSKTTTSYSLRGILDNPGNSVSKAVIPYTSTTTIKPGEVYSVDIDVQVCKSGLLESNCVQYGSNYKPEGLIQKYSKTFTYSVFGYLNISKELQDGAALRAQQAFVGPYTYDPINGVQTNQNNEWDPNTGVFIQNPDSTDASATSAAIGGTTAIADSGVINYINKFGEMNSGNDKSYDPVSEMYYAAIRYLKHQGPVSSYSNITTYQDGTPYKMADGFPVITSWNDPIKYACQKNFILGIGDANTWDDKNLPGNTASTTNEPPVPSEVSADATINVQTATQRIATIEGITIQTPFTGRNNSAYIAGLAYDSHTKDMRPDLTGSQTVSTYWVDVEENQVLLPMSKNQYQLAAKYGGFSVPTGFSPYTYSGPMPKSWWSTTGDVLTTSNINQPRPDNFFEGGNATSMRTGLTNAFSAIYNANQGSIASLALNSSQLQTGSATYQASYTEGTWTGSLKAFTIDPTTKSVSGAALWDASTVIPAYTSRAVYTLVGGNYKAFNSSNVTGNGWTPDVVNYVLGQSTYEIKNGGTYRNRTTALGDIVNGQPIYVGAPNPNTFSGQTFTGSSTYASFATSGTASTRAPLIYVTANDGMLHGFNASTGIETYAYMPGAVLTASTNPSILAQANYGSGVNPHQYFNDGQVTTADVYYSNTWHTVLVGTTGRGVTKAIYALDVTDPTNVKFLWEKSSVDSAYIGQITGRPIIAQTANGWVALLGNGYNSTSKTAALLSIAIDGSSNPAVNVYTAGSGTDNGLATPTILISTVSNGVAATAYAGDLLGHVWSFDLSSTSGAGTLVFTTPADVNGVHQPITSSLLLGKDPLTAHLWLFFGTGKYLTSTDLADKQIQSWYGLIVDGTLPITQTGLVQRSIVYEDTGVAANPLATPPIIARNPARAFSAGSASDLATKSGWYINLISPSGSPEGERMLVGNQFSNGLLNGTSLIPDTSDPCAPGGRGWVMALDPFTGTNPSNNFFDMNGDGVFNDLDKVSVNGSLVPAGGIGFSSLTGSAAFAGNVMLVNQNGVLSSRQLQPQSNTPGRVSWRELINQ
jgi:type IV pilus assembly protein PilY1